MCNEGSLGGWNQWNEYVLQGRSSRQWPSAPHWLHAGETENSQPAYPQDWVLQESQFSAEGLQDSGRAAGSHSTLEGRST